MRRFVAGLAVFFLPLHVAPAHAWGELGHQLVGELAQRQLTPQASARVTELLRNESDPTLAGVAYWADALRGSDPERFRATTRWHYVNMPGRTCHYVAARDCVDGACVVEALETQRRVLRDFTQPSEIRRDALKFLVHFVADVHQPLHASNRPDKGANHFQIELRTGIAPENYARDRDEGGVVITNLHAVWDYYLLASAKLPLRKYADRLAASSHTQDTPQDDPAGWAAESCGLIDRWQLYPPSQKLGEAYLEKMRPLAEQRVVIGARRLAQWLNEAFTLPPSRR